MTEVKNLLSQPHLQYLYTRFMGTNNVAEKTPRRLWDKGVDLLRPSVNVAELPNPEGLSATINEHIRELSTATVNMWEGSIFTKSLEYLLRILLRLHLAPLREERYQRILKEATAKKQLAKEKIHDNSAVTTMSQWKRRLLIACDELSDLLQSNKSADYITVRSQKIAKLLTNLHKLKPNDCTMSKGLPCLEEQARLAAQGVISETNTKEELIGTGDDRSAAESVLLESIQDIHSVDLDDIEAEMEGDYDIDDQYENGRGNCTGL